MNQVKQPEYISIQEKALVAMIKRLYKAQLMEKVLTILSNISMTDAAN